MEFTGSWDGLMFHECLLGMRSKISNEGDFVDCTNE